MKQNYCLIKPIVRQTTLYHKTITKLSHHNYILLTIPDYVDNRTMCQDCSHEPEVAVVQRCTEISYVHVQDLKLVLMLIVTGQLLIQ